MTYGMGDGPYRIIKPRHLKNWCFDKAPTLPSAASNLHVRPVPRQSEAGGGLNRAQIPAESRDLASASRLSVIVGAICFDIEASYRVPHAGRPATSEYVDTPTPGWSSV